VAFTVYDDGSFTQTLYGVSNLPVTGHVVTGQVIDGYQVTKVDAMGNATDSFYDHAGRLTDVWLPAVADAAHGNAMTRPHWHYGYDASGNETAQSDPDGHTTSFAYDEQGHQVVKTLPDDETTRSFYDAYGRLLAMKLYATAGPAATAVKSTTYAFGYYHPDRVIAEYRYAGDSNEVLPVEKTTYTYDDDSGLPAGEQLAQGRVSEVDDYTISAGTATLVHSTHTTYDPVTGQPSIVKSNAGTPQETDVHHLYDPATGRLIETWTGTGTTNDSATTDTLYGYDLQGRLASVSVAKQDGQTPSQTWSGDRFDAVGNAVATTLPTTLYSYDAAGNVIEVLYPNGTETDTDLSNLWNPTNPQEVVTNKRGSTVLSSFTYTFNADRQKISSLEHVLDVGETTFSDTRIIWQYDAENRLTKEIYDYGNNDANTGGKTADDYTASYAYDFSGNRKVQTLDKGNDGTVDQTTTSTYNNDDQLADQLVKDSTGATVSDTISTYNTAGSLQAETITTPGGTTNNTYGYDLRERMTSATVNGQSFAYAYDSDGNRVSETASPGTAQASTTTYVQDTVNPTGYSQVLEQWQGGTTPAVSYVLGASVIAQNANGVNSYLMPDGHGSTRQLTAYTSSSGTNGHVTGRLDYDAFGIGITFTVSSHPANTTDTAVRYTGEFWDAGVGMYDLRARDYRPDLGRFSTSDGITITPGDLENANQYRYAGADPINMWDPSGHEESLAGQVGLTGLQLGLLGLGVATFGASLTLAHHSAAAARATSAAISDIEDWISSGASALEAEGAKLLGRAADVAIAIDDAIQKAYLAGRDTLYALSKLKIFPIVLSAGPQVYAFDVAALNIQPAWHVLNYNGLTAAGVLQTSANRAFVFSLYGSVPAPSGQQLDEFPFASTQQGGNGPFGPAFGKYVPSAQNSFQGTLLGLFYYYELSGGTGPFLVVPIAV
jgi:RHS repeat-associated protein